jgi:hypothetical protein
VSKGRPVEIRLVAEPSRLRMAERDAFRVGIVATNTAPAALDPDVYATRLLVDGDPSPAFDLAIGNGVMPGGWDELPAGATTQPVTWPLGAALFPEPGAYRLELRIDSPVASAVGGPETVVVEA